MKGDTAGICFDAVCIVSDGIFKSCGRASPDCDVHGLGRRLLEPEGACLNGHRVRNGDVQAREVQSLQPSVMDDRESSGEMAAETVVGIKWDMMSYFFR